MKVAVVGLGLIGGSICKALKKHTSHTVFGIDTNPDTVRQALDGGAVDSIITPQELGQADLTFLCLYPQAIIDFANDYADVFAPDSIVLDVCGVKADIMAAVTPVLKARGVTFIGTHPMAGREFSGFAYSTAELFDGASFILTPAEGTPQHAIFVVQMLAEQLKFGKIVTATPQDHDRIIAFTSQLAHVVSNAYVKSPSLHLQKGFSAGSFLDLTRVAKLNEDMWSSLFMFNRAPLLFELDTIIHKLTEYKTALEQSDVETLRSLLRDGRILKEESLLD